MADPNQQGHGPQPSPPSQANDDRGINETENQLPELASPPVQKEVMGEPSVHISSDDKPRVDPALPGFQGPPQSPSLEPNDDQEVDRKEDQVPELPSPPVQREVMGAPPAHIFSEDMPRVDPALLGSQDPEFPAYPGYVPKPGLSFVEQANAMINEALGRTPVGTSIVEPDSIVGESGRLYHGYNEGKYFLPNDAVSYQPP
jgi:hypothetical protein